MQWGLCGDVFARWTGDGTIGEKIPTGEAGSGNYKVTNKHPGTCINSERWASYRQEHSTTQLIWHLARAIASNQYVWRDQPTHLSGDEKRGDIQGYTPKYIATLSSAFSE